MKLKISDIVINQAVAIRHGLDEETVQRYCDVLESLPPAVVFKIDSSYVLSDGFHRREAAIRNGLQEMEVEVKQGTLTDAAEYAISANLKHGKPLTSVELKHALRKLEGLHPDWTGKQLGKALGRSEGWVKASREVSKVRAAESSGWTLPDETIREISYAPKEQWKPLIEAVQEQEWTRDKTREKVRQIKATPERIDEILAPPAAIITVKPPEVITPADQIQPLTQQIINLTSRLYADQYDFVGGRALIQHTLNCLYALIKNATEMIKDLEELPRR